MLEGVTIIDMTRVVFGPYANLIWYLFETLITPDGITIVMEADHFCMQWRAVKNDNTQMINRVMRG